MEGAGGRVSALIDVRGKVFEECLDSICELIVSTSYCGRMLEKGKRMREIRNIENMIRIYVESEREVFLSYLMQFCNVKDQQNVKCEYESLRKQIVAAMIRPSKARKMSTKMLMSHFFFEATFVKSNCFQMRKIVLEFVENFQVMFAAFRKRVNQAMNVIVDRNRKAIELSTQALHEKQTDLEEMKGRVKSLGVRLKSFVGDDTSDSSSAQDELVLKLEEKLEKKTQMCHSLQSQLEKMKKQLARAQKVKYEEPFGDADDIREENIQFKRQIEKLNAEHERLVDEIVAKEERMRNYHSLEAEVQLAATEAEETAQTISTLQSENRDLNLQLSTLMQKSDELTREFEKRGKLLKAAAHHIEKLKAEKETMETEYKAKISDLVTEQQQLLLKRQPTSERFDVRENVECERLKLSVKLAEGELQDAKESLSRNQALIDELRRENTQLKSQLADKDMEIERIQAQARKRQKVHTERYFLAQEPKQQVEVVTPAARHVSADESESDDDYSKSGEDNANKSVEVNKEQSTIIYHLREEVQQQKAKKKRLASAFARVKGELSQSKLADEKSQKQISELKQQVQSLQTELLEKSEENSTLTDNIRRVLKRNVDRCPSDKKLTFVTDERNSLEAELDEMRKEKRESQRNIRVLNRTIKRKDREIEALNHQIMVMKREMLAMKTMKTEAYVMYEHKTEDVQSQNKEYERTIEDLQEQNNDLKQANARLETLLHNATDQYEYEIRDLTEKMASQRETSERISQSLIVENNKLQKEAVGVYQKGRTDRTRIEDLENSIHYYKLRLQKANDTIRGQYQVIKELKSDTSELQVLFKDANRIAFGKTGRQHTVAEILSQLHRLKSLRGQ